jgi:hypothetical protein
MEKQEQILKEVTAEWLADFKPWLTFNTLTFRDPKYPDVAYSYWRRLVQVLNVDAFGKNYVRLVGHSYFSYALAMEYQKRDVVHFHFLADKPLNFDLIHAWWGKACGFAWLAKIEDKKAVAVYTAKYILKSEAGLMVFENTLAKTPIVSGPAGHFRPMWWVTSKGPGLSI